MGTCPRCGGQVDESAQFCPTCGLSRAEAAPSPSPSKRKSPWPLVIAIIAGVLVIGAIANGNRDRSGSAAGSPRPTPRSTVAPTPVPLVAAGNPTITTRTSVGDAITLTLTVRNTGTVAQDFVMGFDGPSGNALFVGCDPECEDMGEALGLRRVRLPGPLPGRSRGYTVTWQALKPTRIEWSIWLAVGDEWPDDGASGWTATTVVLL